MKKILSGLIILIWLVLCFSSLVIAEAVILKSGKKLEGKILEKTDKYIKIDFDGIPLTYYFDEIEKIEGEASVKQTQENLYDEDKIRSIIIDYYKAIDSKDLLN